MNHDTAPVADDHTPPEEEGSRRSRRSLLGVGLGAGIGAAAAATLSAAGTAGAAVGDPVLVGKTHYGGPTSLSNNNGTALRVSTRPDNAALVAVVPKEAGNAPAFDAYAFNGPGVDASSRNADAVRGRARGGYGIYGLSTYGAGVRAESDMSNALEAAAISGTAVLATTGTDPGSRRVAVDARGYVALKATGRVVMDRSGVAVLRAGRRTVRVPVMGGVDETSIAFATMQEYVAGLRVAAVVPDPTTGTVTIHLNDSTDHDVPIGWMVLG